MATIATKTLAEFLAEKSICRVWHSAFDTPTGDEHSLNTEEGVSDEDYCDEESLHDVLTDWLSLDFDSIEGNVSQDADGESRWDWVGGEDLRNCRGNSIHNITVWGV